LHTANICGMQKSAPSKSKKSPKSRKATKFIANLIADPKISATQAAIDAGYSEKSAHSIATENLQKPAIQQVIENSKANALEKAEYGLTQWINDLLEIKERCMQQVAVFDKEGKPTGEYKFDARGATDALDKLSKHFGFYAPEKVQHSGSIITRHETYIIEKVKEEAQNRLATITGGNNRLSPVK